MVQGEGPAGAARFQRVALAIGTRPAVLRSTQRACVTVRPKAAALADARWVSAALPGPVGLSGGAFLQLPRLLRISVSFTLPAGKRR